MRVFSDLADAFDYAMQRGLPIENVRGMYGVNPETGEEFDISYVIEDWYEHMLLQPKSFNERGRKCVVIDGVAQQRNEILLDYVLAYVREHGMPPKGGAELSRIPAKT